MPKIAFCHGRLIHGNTLVIFPAMANHGVTLKILGCGNAFADGGRFNTCFFVTAASRHYLIDCGATSIVAIRKAGIEVSSIDTIVLSHLHADHAAGVPFVEMAGRKTRKKPKIVGPQGTAALINKLLTAFFPEVKQSASEFYEYTTGQTFMGEGIAIFAQQSCHEPLTNPHSLRLTIDDKVIAFSGDTEWYEDLIALAHRADLFICECTNVDGGKGHMSYQLLKQHRSSIRAKRMIITHMAESVLALEHCVFEKAYDGMEILI